MTVKEYTEKIEHFFSKHKHRWFDLFNGTDTYREQSERALLSPIKESIFSLLETVRIYENDLPGIMTEKVRERIESLEKAIEETAKRLDTSNDPAIQKEFEVNAGENKELRLFERDGKKLYFKEVRLNQSERDFGYCLATKLPEIEFWKWYLSEHFKQNKEVKATNEKEEPQKFENFLDPKDIDATLRAMRKEGIINDLNLWIHGSRKGAIMAVVQTLIDRGKIIDKDKGLVARLLAEKIGTTISERTIRNTSHHMNDLITQLKALIE